MYIETERLLIRSLKLSDEKAFIEMASDGSLTEIYGDCSECHKWMGDFIKEAMQLELENNPNKEFLAYAIETKNEYTAIGSVGTSYYDDLLEIGVTYFIGAKFRGKGYAAEALRAYRILLKKISDEQTDSHRQSRKQSFLQDIGKSRIPTDRYPALSGFI